MSERLRRADCRGRFCPPGRGCNMSSGWQGCHLCCVEMHSDREAVEAVRYWARRYWSTPFYRRAQRREARRIVGAALERGYASPLLPPPRVTLNILMPPCAERVHVDIVKADILREDA